MAPPRFDDSALASGQHLLSTSMFWNPTGGVRRVLSTRHALIGALGWRHTVLAPGAIGPGTIDCGGWTLPFTGGYRWPGGRSWLQPLIEAAEPDLIEAADPYSLAWAGLGAAERLGVPAVAFCHSLLPQMAARWLGGPAAQDTRRGRWAAARARAYLVDLYDRFDLVLAPSETVAADLRRWGLDRVQVQRLGVDCSVFNPAAANPVWRVRLARRLGVSPHTHLLVYSGRFAPEKNLDTLAEAVRRLGPGHLLVAVGNGPAPPRGERVVLMSPIGDPRRLARLVASADVYVHAGDRETFGLGVLEAMACGTPLVVASRGGVAELARDAAMLADPRNGDDWADAILGALEAGRNATTGAALARARALDWRLVMRQMSQRYLSLLRRHAAARAPLATPSVSLAGP